MEKISATPLAHNNNNNNSNKSKKLTEISSTNTTKGNMLKLDFDTMPKLVESSVRANVPLRANFVKSNTCGSLFAKCNCSHHSKDIIPLISEVDCDREASKFDRHTRKNQSFSHPDTPVIFTEENRYPIDPLPRLRSSHETVFRSGNQEVEIKHSKRSSSPNIGNFTSLNVDIHPEFKVQVIPKSFTLQETTRRKPILKKGSKSFPSATRSNFRSFDSLGEHTFSSSYSVDEESEELELNGKVTELIVTDLDASSTSQSTTVVDTQQTKRADEKALSSPKKITTENAERFFQESGILGPMGGGSSILKKSSKIKPVLTDSITKDNIRKTSLVLLGYSNNDLRKRSISESYTEYPFKDGLAGFGTLTLHEEILHLRETIKNRDDEISRLKREIHKLKSVLQQQATRNLKCECNFSSLRMNGHVDKTTKKQNKFNSNDDIQKSSAPSSTASTINKGSLPLQINNISKRQGVSGESCDVNVIGCSSDILIRKFEKDFKSKQQIKDAVLENDFLKYLDCVQIRELVESMYSRDVDLGEFIVRENETGNHLFVSAQGEFEIIVNDKVLGSLPAGKAFGELAILYNCKRTASIRAVTPNSRVWVLDRRAFQQIMMRTGLQRIEENVKFLKSIPLLQNLDDNELCKIADVLELEFYPDGAYIIRQGAVGDNFFLISQGNVKVTQKIPGRSTEEEIRTLGRGDYFGEQSLLKEDRRSANIIAMAPGVECLTLDRESFKQHIGDLEELHKKDYGDKDRIYALKQIETRQIQQIEEKREIEKEYANIEFGDLKTLATVGVGGFGRVMLVKHTKDNALRIFALKQMKKVHILETKQEEHVFNERRIMLS
ncbi:CLUMA_CG007330, isoform A [Clunio marinus]|uniref:CLUMA_CG007330, isoform A n=1 Tax=Clunio marinus TaxID=568069 RepID=A0A1J1I0T0_9DIPT|nr:CLUMA_CG007330, isoform A [Clunio marinus]